MKKHSRHKIQNNEETFRHSKPRTGKQNHNNSQSTLHHPFPPESQAVFNKSD